jgi:hypothetical protein
MAARLGLVVVAAVGLAIGSASCVAGIETPKSVEPTLSALAGSGLACAAPQRDNVPSGLLQWRCEGDLKGEKLVVLVDGDVDGVFEFTATILSASDRHAQSETFVSLLRTTGIAGNHEDEFVHWLQDWDGKDGTIEFGRANGRLFAEDVQPTLNVRPGPRRFIGDPAGS